MINNVYLFLLISCILAISVFTLITDFKHGKILNKHLGLFMKIGFMIQLCYSFYLILYEKQIQFLGGYIINFIIGTCISICLYYFNIWGAGDSKYVILLLLISPIKLFQEKDIFAFQGLLIFIITFSIAFIYLFGESLYLFITESPTLVHKNNFNMLNIKEFFIKWIFSYSVITVIYRSISIVSRKFLANNMILIRFLIILSMFYFLDKVKKKSVYVLMVVLAFLMTIFDCIINGYNSKFLIDYKILIYVILIIIIRNLCSSYNYKKIKTLNIEEGMVLSAGTFVGFFNSRVKGLPNFKSESIHSRINLEEAESIKRWSKSKYGQEYIYIVRQIPFAPFISLGAIGSILYFIL